MPRPTQVEPYSESSETLSKQSRVGPQVGSWFLGKIALKIELFKNTVQAYPS